MNKKEAILGSIRVLWTDNGIEMEFASVRPEDLKEVLDRLYKEEDGSVIEIMELYGYVLESLEETRRVIERRLTK